MLKHFIKSPTNVQLTTANWSPIQANPQRPPGMPPMIPASSSEPVIAKAAEEKPKTSRIPPAASTRTGSRSATHVPGQSATAAPAKASQPVPAIRGTARTASHSTPKVGTGKETQIPGTTEETTGPRVEGRIFYRKGSKKDTGASKADSRQEERTEKERSRDTQSTRRDKAESLHQVETCEPAAIEIDEREIKDLVNHYDDNVTITVINQICKVYHREEKVFKLIQRLKQPTACLLYLLQKYREITYANVVELFQESADDSHVTSSILKPNSPRQSQASQEPMQVKQEEVEDSDDLTGTKYRSHKRLARRAAPVILAAATERTNASISPTPEDDRAELEHTAEAEEEEQPVPETLANSQR